LLGNIRVDRTQVIVAEVQGMGCDGEIFLDEGTHHVALEALFVMTT